MKNFKKFTATVAATLMAATMVAPMAMNFSVSAEETAGAGDTAATNNEVTVNLTIPTSIESAELNNIKAYQIFTLDKTGTDPYSITGWASDDMMNAVIAAYNAQQSDNTKNITSPSNDEEKAAALTTVTTWLGGADAVNVEAFAKVVVSNIPENATAIEVTKNTDNTLKMSADKGYYVFTCDVQKTDDEGNPIGTYEAKSLGMLQAVDGTTVEVGEKGVAKVGLPTVQKKVKENQEANYPVDVAPYETDDKSYNDIADYNIGDAVPFKLYGTMPQDIDKYSAYYYCFNDTLDSQFDAPTELTINVGDATYTASFSENVWTVKKGTEDVKYIHVTTAGTDNTTIKVAFEDVKTANASLNKDTLVTVEYTAVLNSTAVVGNPGQNNAVTLSYSNNPNFGYKPDTTDDNEDKPGEGNEGETPEDKVRVYTYGFEFEKFFVTGGERSDITAEELAKWQSGGSDAINFELKDGTGENAKNIYVKPAGENEEGWNYVLAKEGDKDATTVINLFEITKGDGTKGLAVKIKGLDEGTYYLTETKAPSGYNAVENVKVEITANTGNTQDWGMTEDTLTKFEYTVGEATKVTQDNTNDDETDNVTGIAKGEIDNKKGVLLPSTGGIGTTLFYLGGGAMVAVAGVFLITKKRMGKDEA